MIRSIMNGAEQAISKLLIVVFGLMILSLFMLVGLAFMGYALFLFMSSWLPELYSALMTACVFILIGFMCIRAVKFGISPKQSNIEKAPQVVPKSCIKNNPTMSLSMSAAAGFLYEADPRLKSQVNDMLIDLIVEYANERSDKD